jgi:glutaredoxin
MLNQKPISLTLYSTSHCHLCEQAYSLLVRLEKSTSITWQTIDITRDEKILLEYETRIPVIERQDNKIELSWPFTYQDIQTFIAN